MIFLSASIPTTDIEKIDYPDIDVIAIREAIKALAIIIIPHTQLIWGGHPAITPLIRFLMEHSDVAIKNHVTLYQSAYFREIFPNDNQKFEKIIITPVGNNRADSLAILRKQMIQENDFHAAIFIGGMKGVEEEFDLFQMTHPKAILLPLGSTGGTAKKIAEKLPHIDENSSKSYIALFSSMMPQLCKKA